VARAAGRAGAENVEAPRRRGCWGWGCGRGGGARCASAKAEEEDAQSGWMLGAASAGIGSGAGAGVEAELLRVRSLLPQCELSCLPASLATDLIQRRTTRRSC